MNRVDSAIAEANGAAEAQLRPMTPEEIRSLSFNASDYRAREHMFYRLMQETAAQLAEFNRRFDEVLPRLIKADQGTHPGKD